MARTYFLSFIEEAVMNPDYTGYIAGRIEVIPDDSETGYSDEEIRFLTRRVKAFDTFRERWDFKDVDEATLGMIRETTARKFCDTVK